MKVLLTVSIILLLICVIYQDFKYRAIPWIVFPVLAINIIFFNQNFFENFFDHLFNLFFIIIQLGLITLYITIKERRWVKIWEKHLGLGDILFLGILSLLFSPLNFISFYVASLIITIAVVLAIRLIKKDFWEIPLAGLQALFLAFLFLIDLSGSSVDFFYAPWIMSLLDGRVG